MQRVIEEVGQAKEVEVDLGRVRDIRCVQVVSEMVAHGEAKAKRVVIRGNEK
jgi:NADPH-dependent glutamate synthase beta subunit-like oxidoreductase